MLERAARGKLGALGSVRRARHCPARRARLPSFLPLLLLLTRSLSAMHPLRRLCAGRSPQSGAERLDSKLLVWGVRQIPPLLPQRPRTAS